MDRDREELGEAEEEEQEGEGGSKQVVTAELLIGGL